MSYVPSRLSTNVIGFPFECVMLAPTMGAPVYSSSNVSVAVKSKSAGVVVTPDTSSCVSW
jgi:hypothetical protein